jgi:N-acetylglucosaminyl-diphospho-decaprenol L-rhamnosyltransferase
MMHVAIAIVSFRNPDDVMRCLEGLGNSQFQDFEVVVCENGGPEAFEALSARIPGRLAGGQAVQIVNAGGNLGYAGGVNRCIAETRQAQAWWILNPDTYPSPEALLRMVERLSQGDCDAVGNTVHHPSGVVQSYGGVWRTWLARAVSIGHGAQVEAAVDAAAVEARQNYLNGASMLVSNRFVETAGLMREEYFLYCEEVEWCLRGRALGMRLGFAAHALVLHEQGTSTGNSTDLKLRSRLSVFLNERNRLLLTRDCYPRALPVAAIAALILLSLRFGRRGAWKQLSYALQGWWSGLRDRRGALDDA